MGVQGPTPGLYMMMSTLVFRISPKRFSFVQGVSQQITKTVAKSVNPHYNAMLHFTNISREILLKTTIHAAILGKSIQFGFHIDRSDWVYRDILLLCHLIAANQVNYIKMFLNPNY